MRVELLSRALREEHRLKIKITGPKWKQQDAGRNWVTTASRIVAAANYQWNQEGRGEWGVWNAWNRKETVGIPGRKRAPGRARRRWEAINIDRTLVVEYGHDSYGSGQREVAGSRGQDDEPPSLLEYRNAFD